MVIPYSGYIGDLVINDSFKSYQSCLALHTLLQLQSPDRSITQHLVVSDREPSCGVTEKSPLMLTCRFYGGCCISGLIRCLRSCASTGSMYTQNQAYESPLSARGPEYRLYSRAWFGRDHKWSLGGSVLAVDCGRS